MKIKKISEMEKNVIVSSLKQNQISLGTRIMFENEKLHAQEAIESGIYVTWCSKDVITQPFF